MAFVFSITNQKGGVGKTTTSISLSMALSEKKYRVLLIDADPQSNASNGLNIKNPAGFYDFLADNRDDLSHYVQTSRWSGFHVLPADPRLSGLDLEWAAIQGRSFILKKKLAGFLSSYDYIFIDCPPSLGLLTVNALTASEYFIIPLQCEYYALEGLSLLLKTAHSIKKNLNPRLQLIGILLTMFDSRNTLSHKVAEQVSLHFKEKVFKTIIPRNVRLSEAPSHGLPISVYDPGSTGAITYQNLAQELSLKMSKLNNKRGENVLSP